MGPDPHWISGEKKQEIPLGPCHSPFMSGSEYRGKLHVHGLFAEDKLVLFGGYHGNVYLFQLIMYKK